MDDYFICSHCGARVKMDAAACPECGSDDNTGWSEDSRYDGLWLPEESVSDPDAGIIPWGRLGITAVTTLILASFLTSILDEAIYFIPVLLLAAAGLYYVIGRSPQNGSTPSREVELYENLLRKARGDAALLERWVDYERDRTPNAPRRELLEAAIHRWERDNR